MAKVKIQGNASGTGVFTITPPATSTDRTLTLPDSAGTILDSTSTLDATKLSGNLPAISGASLTNLPGGGKVLQVVSLEHTGTFTSTSGSWVDVTDFTMSITPASSSSKILVLFDVKFSHNNWYGLKVVRTITGTPTDISIGDSSNLGSRQYQSFGSRDNFDGQATVGHNLSYLDSPSTTSSVTYKLQTVGRWGTTTGTVAVNRGVSWNNDAISGRVPGSNIILMEIGV